MLRMHILGPIVLLLARAPCGARTAVKSPKPSRLLADYSAALEDLAQLASPSVVQIQVRRLAPVGKNDSQRTGFVSEQQATGSGVIVDPDGYIVTNAHVVQNAQRIEVKVLQSDARGQSPHEHLVPAQLVGVDRQVDIAVVKIEAQKLPALSFLNSDNLRQGPLVVSMGNPLGFQNSFPQGVGDPAPRQLYPVVPLDYTPT